MIAELIFFGLLVGVIGVYGWEYLEHRPQQQKIDFKFRLKK